MSTERDASTGQWPRPGHPGHPGHHCPRYCHDRRTGYQHVAAASCLILCASCHSAHCLPILHVIPAQCSAVLCWQMKEHLKLPEPTSADHLAKLVGPRKRAGGQMSATACQDPAKAKHMGKCCGGSRVWGEGNATEYIDSNHNSFGVYCCAACKRPLQFPAAKSLSVVSVSPATLSEEQRAAIEVKRQAALARKRAREESSPPPPPAAQMQLDAPCREALCNSSDSVLQDEATGPSAWRQRGHPTARLHGG